MNNKTNFADENQLVESPEDYTVFNEETKQLILRRGRDIKSGRMRLIPHEEVMREMEASLQEAENDFQ